MKKQFSRLSKNGKIILISLISVFGLGIAGIASGHSSSSNIQQNISTPTQPSFQKETSLDKVPRVTTVQEVTESSTVPYESTTVEDSSMEQGSQVKVVNGENGETQTTYKVTYLDGKETSREAVKATITKAPINEVVHKGTKVSQPACQNGTYVNTSGTSVCSPYASSSAPAGATAKCSDGTYSFSQSRRGTCSHHGGVASWL